MTWVAVAIGGSAILGYMGSQSAANQASNAANAANQVNQSQYNQTRQDQLPWMNRGNAAGNQLAWLMGLPGYGPSYGGGNAGNTASIGPGGRPHYQGVFNMDGGDGAYFGGNNWSGGAIDQTGNTPGTMNANQYNPAMGGYGSLARGFGAADFQADPGYAFRLAEGKKALERSAAAKGMSLSGAQAKALTNYNQNFASNEYSNAYGRFTNDQTNLFNRLSGIAGTGQQANQFMGQLGANYANQFGNNVTGAANMTGAATMQGMNALSGGFNQWLNQNNWNRMMGGGQGGGGYTPPGGGNNFDWANGW